MPDQIAGVPQSVVVPQSIFNLGPTTTGFGDRAAFTGLPHMGIDIGVPVGTVVPVPVGGTLTRVYSEREGGLVAEVTDANGFTQIFGHLSKVTGQIGDMILPGGSIAVSGASGIVTGPHVHYQVKSPDGTSIDPKLYASEFGAVSSTPAASSPTGAQTASPMALLCPGGGELTQIGPLTFCRYMVAGFPVLTPAAPSSAPVVGGAAKIIDTLSSQATWYKVLFTVVGLGMIVVGAGIYVRGGERG